MIFVGIDPSVSNTGIVALSESGGLLGAWNSKLIPKIKGDKQEARYLRLAAIADYVVDIIREHGPECCIGYEDYSYDSVHKAETLGELGGVLRLRLIQEFGLPIFIAPTSLKKFATGYGHSSKEKVQAQAKLEEPLLGDLPPKEATSDICDAYFLAKAAMYTHNPEKAVEADSTAKLVRLRLASANGWNK